MEQSQNQLPKKPVVLISMDGVGVAPPGPGNAVILAKTPNLDAFWPKYPHGTLEAAGLYVGLPEGSDGNSEVGHVTMGAGKIILQDLPRIDNAIKLGAFYENPALLKAIEHAKANNSNLHVLGLCGTGGVHSSLHHLFAIIELVAKQQFDGDRLFIHAITDGRDSSVNAGMEVLEQIEAKCIQKKSGRIASIIGRAFGMDRNKNWARTKMAYDLYTQGTGKVFDHWRKALQDSYDEDKMDEYVEPRLIQSKGMDAPAVIKPNDSVILFNFRPDRAQQITRAFEDPSFPGWQREMLPNLYFTGLTDYQGGFPKIKAFPPEAITHPLGRIISEAGYSQLRIAESEKFPHVTYFFNGGNGAVFQNEKWLEVPSPTDVATYDEKPHMSQDLMTDTFLEQLATNQYDFFVINFAAPDMVAHTGVIDASITAMENCDYNVGRIVEAVLKLDGAVLISADHGNCEELIDLQTGEPDTKHSINQVPILVVKNGLQAIELPVGTLADIAPTVLSLLSIPQPPEMTGRNLLG